MPISEAQYALETAGDPHMPADYLWMLERLYRANVDEFGDCPSWQPLLSEARISLDELWRSHAR